MLPSLDKLLLATGARRVSTDPQSEAKRERLTTSVISALIQLVQMAGISTVMKRAAFLMCSTMSVSKNGRRLAGQSLNVCFAVQWCYKTVR